MQLDPKNILLWQNDKYKYLCGLGGKGWNLSFFFFWETRPDKSVYYWIKRNYKESQMTIGAMSSGTQFCQTWSSQPDLEDLSKQWATKFPCRFTWEKLQKEKKLTSWRTSRITFPYSGWEESKDLMACTITLASPSKMQSNTLCSFAKNMALWYANAFAAATNVGLTICWAKAWSTLLELSQMTIPRLAVPSEEKKATSKFTLPWGEIGGIHLIALTEAVEFWNKGFCTTKKSWRKEFAQLQILLTSTI